MSGCGCGCGCPCCDDDRFGYRQRLRGSDHLRDPMLLGINISRPVRMLFDARMSGMSGMGGMGGMRSMSGMGGMRAMYGDDALDQCMNTCTKGCATILPPEEAFRCPNLCTKKCNAENK